jgi:hypothetical protein
MVVIYVSASFCRYYEVQQSGHIAPWNRVSRSAGGWRGNSHVYDGLGEDGGGVDMSGGWYDAGGE